MRLSGTIQFALFAIAVAISAIALLLSEYWIFRQTVAGKIDGRHLAAQALFLCAIAISMLQAFLHARTRGWYISKSSSGRFLISLLGMIAYGIALGIAAYLIGFIVDELLFALLARIAV